MDYRIFNVRTDVNACDCTRGCMDTARESALKVDSGRKIPCRIGESNLRQRRDGLMLYQLSYIPSPLASLYLKKDSHKPRTLSNGTDSFQHISHRSTVDCSFFTLHGSYTQIDKG